MSLEDVDRILDSPAFSSLMGWCEPKKAKLIARLVVEAGQAQPPLCVEIGVFGGRGVVAMGLASKHVLGGAGRVDGIDPYAPAASLEGTHSAENNAYWSKVDYKAVLQSARDGITRLGLNECVRIILGRSQDVVQDYATKSIHVLSMDGNHSEECAVHDVAEWAPKIASGGFWIFDDIHWHEGGHPSTKLAQENLIAKHEFTLLEEYDSWAIYQAPEG